MIKKELGLVDNLIFEAYKEKELKSSDEFKKEIRLSYGLIPNSEVYRRIVNYQIKKYGKQLDSGTEREWVKYFELKSTKQRKRGIKRIEERRKQHRFIERVENEKKQ